MAHGTVGTLSHHPGDASDRWIVLRSIDWLCRQGGGKGFLKLQIAFGVGGIWGWWARGRVEGSGEVNWVWASCPDPHGKSQWDSCHLFSKYQCICPRAIDGGPVFCDPIVWAQFKLPDRNLLAPHRQGTPLPFAYLKRVVGNHFPTDAI